MNIIGSIKKKIHRRPIDLEENRDGASGAVETPLHMFQRTMTVGSDDVFEKQETIEPVEIREPVTRGRSFNRSLSLFRPELPTPDAASRRFIFHNRGNFTNTWLNLHDFNEPGMTASIEALPQTPRSAGPSNRFSIASRRDQSSRNSMNPRQIHHLTLVPNRPPLSTCYDDEAITDKSDDPNPSEENDEDTVIEMRNPNDVIEDGERGQRDEIQGMSRSSSISSSNSEQNSPDQSERWIDNLDAKNSVIIALTVFYALTMTIFALVLELSHLLSGEDRRAVQAKDLIFGLYMYGMAVIFLFYCYAVLLLNPRWRAVIERIKCWLNLRKFSSESTTDLDDNSSIAAATVHRKVSHDAPSAGSLFLRLGCVVFGVIGTVYYSFNAFLGLSENTIEKGNIALDVCAILFIFTQMHFLFCNWKMTIMGHHTIARFGTMHLVAANLWTWIRYVLIEESVMDKEIRHIFTPHDYSSNKSDIEYEEGFEHTSEESTMGVSELLHGKTVNRMTRSVSRECTGADCILGSITDIMYTSIVEYSLIGAAVMFIVWKNIDHVRETPTAYVKRKHQIRVDCSKTTSGLFCGLAFLAATFTSMAVFYGYSLIKRNHTAALVFSITDIIQYVIASLGCIYALWQMRLLRYHRATLPKLNVNPSQELLDMILLSLGMIGEMIYSVAGLVGLTGDKTWQPLSLVLLFCHITRLLQVGLQSCLIYIAGKLRIQGDFELRKRQPGKQVITFLLIANIAMFFMNLLESEKAGISETVVNFYGKKSWVFLVRSFSPLTIFYRFHSSVCLAEINIIHWDTKYEQVKSEVIGLKDKETGTPITVIECKICAPVDRNLPVLVVSSLSNVKIYDMKDLKLLISVALDQNTNIPPEEEGDELPVDLEKELYNLARGITYVDNFILVGTSSGDIMVFNCNGESSVSLKKSLIEHKCSIIGMATCSYDHFTVSADVQGNVSVWNRSLKQVTRRISTGHCISAINILRKHALCGTYQGQVLLFNVITGELKAEVTPHARAISSISVAPESAYMLTAAQDGHVCVWKLHTRKPEAFGVEFRHCEKVPNRVVTGAQFANCRGNAFVSAAYDCSKLSVYKIAKRPVH